MGGTRDPRTRDLRRTAPLPEPKPSASPNLSGFNLGTGFTRAGAPGPLPTGDDGKALANAALLRESINKFFPALSAQGGATQGQIPVDLMVQWVMARLGVTAAEAIVRIQADDGTLFDSFLKETAPKSGSGASPPVERFSHEVIGGRVFRFGDMGSPPVDTGLTAPGFTNVSTDRAGNLTGINAQGNFQVIQPGYGFASIDPEREFNENARQFDVAEGGRNRRNTESESAANQRQLLSAQTQGFQSVNQLAPQLGQLALDNAKFTSDATTKTDFLARAFFQRGQTSPLPQITQADIINQLRNNIGGFQNALSGFNNTFPGFSSSNTAAVPSPAASPAPAGFSAPSSAVPQPGPQTTPNFVEDGFGSVRPDGGISPLTRPGTPSFVTEGMATPAAGDNGLAATLAANAAWEQAMRARTAQPTGFTAAPISFAAPTLPTVVPVTQTELQSMELANRPPAINDVLNGRVPSALRFGFDLPTPQQLNALTPDESAAFKTTLATQYNTTPEDVGFAVNKRFATSRGSRAGTVAGFA